MPMSLIPSLLGALLTYAVVQHVLMFVQNLSMQSLKGRKQREIEYLQSFQTTIQKSSDDYFNITRPQEFDYARFYALQFWDHG